MANAFAYLVETPEFKSQEAKQAFLRDEGEFGIVSYPNETYLTVVADASNQPAEYQLQLSFRELTDAEVLEMQLLYGIEAE